MPNQVDGALVRAPCPVPSCPACEPNSGSVLPSLSTNAYSSRGGRYRYAIKCRQAYEFLAAAEMATKWWRREESEYSGVLKTRNLLIFRDAKNAENGKIAPNWNVSGTWDFPQ